MNPDLTNQSALVTGAGRGIGKAIALSLGRCGAHVHLAARNAAELDAVAKAIQGSGGRATVHPLDLMEEGQIVRTIAGIERLDVLINNAGIGIFSPVAEFSAADLDRIHAVNVRGSFICCREALKRMIPRKSGYIINISSVVGFKGYANQAAYSASKHAVMGLTKSLAVECQPHNIRVSAILPGGVDTDMVGAARPDLPREGLIAVEQIADTVLYLLAMGPTTAAVDQIYIRRKTSSPF